MVSVKGFVKRLLRWLRRLLARLTGASYLDEPE